MRRLLMLLLLILLFGCKGAKELVYVDVPKVEVEYRDKIVRDSVYLSDTVRIEHKGDTVFQRSQRYLYRDKIVRDSIYLTDTITIPKPVKVPVITNRLNAFQRFSVWGFWLLVGIGILLGLFLWRR